MNKYAAVGLIREAVKGRHIVVVAGVPADATHAFGEFDSLLNGVDEVRKVVRVNGAFGFHFDGGGRIDIRLLPGALRGMSADVVYLEAEVARSIDHAEIRDQILPVLAGSDRGEIIRA